jgi:hypothetical protein
MSVSLNSEWFHPGPRPEREAHKRADFERDK